MPLVTLKRNSKSEFSKSRTAITNFLNYHLWPEDNRHAVIEYNTQQKFSINIWIGIISEHLISTHFIPHRLKGEEYRRFLEYELPGLIEEIPLCQQFFM